MELFVFYTLVPALFFAVLLLGALCVVFAILSALYSDSAAGDSFDTLLIIMFGGLCIVGIMLMVTMSISGLVMLCY